MGGEWGCGITCLNLKFLIGMSLFTFFINVLCQILKYFQMCIVYFDILLGLMHVDSQNLPWQVSSIMQWNDPTR